MELLRRTAIENSAYEPNLTEAAFDELAAELFRGYDAEEAARADP